MRTRIVTGFVAAAASAQLAAQGGATMQSYQFDLTGGWSMSETDTSPEIEVDQYILAGTYHLKPVQLADQPWNEAAFLEHSTFVQAGAVFADFEIGNFSADGPLFVRHDSFLGPEAERAYDPARSGDAGPERSYMPDEVTRDHSSQLVAAAYRPVKKLDRDDGADTHHCGGSKGDCDQLKPVRLHRFLREGGRFDYLQALGLLISVQSFTETRSREFAIGFGKSGLERFSLPLESLNVIRLCRLSFCRRLCRLR